MLVINRIIRLKTIDIGNDRRESLKTSREGGLSMSEEKLILHCSPTLAGLKTGNLFSCSYTTLDELKRNLRELNRRLGKRGLRIIPVRCKDGRALIYVYRPSRLARDFENPKVQDILYSCGYSSVHPSECLRRLISRVGTSKEFPHEIGLFLGYPPEDVEGFICEKRNKNASAACKFVGAWKVYGDMERAKRLFSQFKKCTSVYTNQWISGQSLERLTVIG